MMKKYSVGGMDFCSAAHLMIPSYYKSPSNDFTVIKGDCVDTLSKFSFGFDMVFADPPYFLSGGGISYQSGQIVCGQGRMGQAVDGRGDGRVQPEVVGCMQGAHEGGGDDMDLGHAS